MAAIIPTRTSGYISAHCSGHIVIEINTLINLGHGFKGAQSRLNGLKSLAKLFKFVVCNPCQSSPSLTILVPLWFTIILSLVFLYLEM